MIKSKHIMKIKEIILKFEDDSLHPIPVQGENFFECAEMYGVKNDLSMSMSTSNPQKKPTGEKIVFILSAPEYVVNAISEKVQKIMQSMENLINKD